MAQAELYIRQINQTFQSLQNDPFLGQVCDDIRSGYRKILAGKHVIFYRVEADMIDVIRILHQSRDVSLHF